MRNDFTVLDMFAGAGGMSEGFFRQKYRFVSHIEKDTYAATTLMTRAAYHSLRENNREDVYYEYLKADISREQLLEEANKFTDTGSVLNYEIREDNEKVIIKNIKERMKAMEVKKIDLIIGGPPCQAYSVIGRSRVGDRIEKDPRNYLFIRYLSFLKTFAPSIFVFENVPGIRTAIKGKAYLDFVSGAGKLGYYINERILDASDFGVLQKRKRIIIIGWRKDMQLTYPEFENVNHGYMVSSILSDLPPLTPGEGMDGVQAYYGPITAYLRRYRLRTKKDVLIHHVARRHNERDREIYRYVIAVWDKERRRVKYNELPENLKTHKNRTVFEDRFKVVASDLPYAQTVTAHISKDGHYFIHPDIRQARSITVREAARIQSFPDNFKFEGPRTAQYRQIGNAVPPLLSERIAIEMKKMLEAA